MRRLVITLAAAATLAPGIAMAQLIPPSGQVGPAQHANVGNKPEPAPPALPGAKSGGPIVGAQRAARNLSPNDQLFDAIDRGDIGSARDALSRGADLRSRNALGETPIELSVNLARNDITFLLLSSRGGEPAPGARQPTTNPIKEAAARPLPARAAPAPQATSRPAPMAPQVRPQTVSNDPGVPNPSAGFLGFGPVQH